MIEFRLTKYNPINRNDAGHYLLDEWTCFSEVESVTLEEYEKVEKAYIDTAFDFSELWTNGIVTVSGLEDYDDNTNLKEGQEININDISSILRSVLRNEFWCRLECDDGFIHVGWDFYMYIGVPEINQIVLSNAQQRGVFVEDCVSPYHQEQS